MITQPPLLCVLPTSVLDRTTDFTPLFIGLVLGLCLSVLGLAFAIGVYDSWWSQRRAQGDATYRESLPPVPDAAR
jgi:hypothetical protein